MISAEDLLCLADQLEMYWATKHRGDVEATSTSARAAYLTGEADGVYEAADWLRDQAIDSPLKDHL